MSEHPSTNRENSDQDADKTREITTGGVEEIDEGYETPTSEEHRIPPVDLSCPPPPPRKRKRLVVERRAINIEKVELLTARFVEKGELDSLFDFLVAKCRAAPPPPPSPEPDQGTSSKKMRSAR